MTDNKIYVGKRAISNRLGISKYLLDKWIRELDFPIYRENDQDSVKITEKEIEKWIEATIKK